MTFYKRIIVLIMIFLMASCDYIQYSPNELLDNTEKYNEKNLELILYDGLRVDNKFSFAILSDNHHGYDSLKMTVDHINKENLDFTIHMGDITDNGLSNEYKISNKIIRGLNTPFLVLLGNHDTLANGKEIFKNLYGDSLNFSFIYGNSKFIILNTNSWEFPDENVPDLDWLEDELFDRSLYKNVFVLTHIPPFVRGFDKKKAKRYQKLMKEYNVTYSIHGHLHRFWKGDYYNDGVTYVLIDDTRDKNFTIISVDEDKVDFEVKAFAGTL